MLPQAHDSAAVQYLSTEQTQLSPFLSTVLLLLYEVGQVRGVCRASLHQQAAHSSMCSTGNSLKIPCIPPDTAARA